MPDAVGGGSPTPREWLSGLKRIFDRYECIRVDEMLIVYNGGGRPSLDCQIDFRWFQCYLLVYRFEGMKYRASLLQLLQEAPSEWDAEFVRIGRWVLDTDVANWPDVVLFRNVDISNELSTQTAQDLRKHEQWGLRLQSADIEEATDWERMVPDALKLMDKKTCQDESSGG